MIGVWNEFDHGQRSGLRDGKRYLTVVIEDPSSSQQVSDGTRRATACRPLSHLPHQLPPPLRIGDRHGERGDAAAPDLEGDLRIGKEVLIPVRANPPSREDHEVIVKRHEADATGAEQAALTAFGREQHDAAAAQELRRPVAIEGDRCLEQQAPPAAGSPAVECRCRCGHAATSDRPHGAGVPRTTG